MTTSSAAEGRLQWNDEDSPLTNRELRKLLKLDRRKGVTCAGGKAALPLPGLTVGGVGQIALPLLPSQAECMKSAAVQAPCGKGMQTIVDTNIRNSLQIDASAVKMTNPAWAIALKKLVTNTCQTLGIDGNFVESQLYKLLLYEKGGHFKPHKDTEKLPGMFATLVVQFPSQFTGGAFIVRHGGNERVFRLGGDDLSAQSEFYFAAHYADCEHEIQEVTSGYRLAAVYSLRWKGMGPPPSVPSGNTVYKMARGLVRLRHAVGVPLSHQYTPASLGQFGLRALKGQDRDVVDILLSSSALLQENDADNEVVLHIVRAKRVDEEYGDGWDERSFELSDVNKGVPNLATDEIYSANRSPVSESALSILSDLSLTSDLVEIDSQVAYADEDEHESSDEDSASDENLCEDGEEESHSFWTMEKHGRFHYTGNEGATRETTYSCCILTLWPKRAEAGILWRRKLPFKIQSLEILKRSDLAMEIRRILPTVRSVIQAEKHDSDSQVGLAACTSLLEHGCSLGDRELVQHIISMGFGNITWIRLGATLDHANYTGASSPEQSSAVASICSKLSLVHGFSSGGACGAVMDCVKHFGTDVLCKARRIIYLDIATSCSLGTAPATDRGAKGFDLEADNAHTFIQNSAGLYSFYTSPTPGDTKDGNLSVANESSNGDPGHDNLNGHQTNAVTHGAMGNPGNISSVISGSNSHPLHASNMDTAAASVATAANLTVEGHRSLSSLIGFAATLKHKELQLAMFPCILKLQYVSPGPIDVASCSQLLALANDLGRADFAGSALRAMSKAAHESCYKRNPKNYFPVSTSRQSRMTWQSSASIVNEDIGPLGPTVNVAVLNAIKRFGWATIGRATLSFLADVAGSPVAVEGMGMITDANENGNIPIDGNENSTAGTKYFANVGSKYDSREADSVGGTNIALEREETTSKITVRFLDGRLNLITQLVEVLLQEEEGLGSNHIVRDLCEPHLEGLILALGQGQLREWSKPCMAGLRLLLSLPSGVDSGQGYRHSSEPRLLSKLRTSAQDWPTERQDVLLQALRQLDQVVSVAPNCATGHGHGESEKQNDAPAAPILESAAWVGSCRARARELSRAILSSRCDAARAKLVALGPEPVFSWAMPDATLDFSESAQAFLRGPTEHGEIGGHSGIAAARKFAQRILDVQYCRQPCHFTARAQAFGSGKTAFVEIAKTRKYFETASQPWSKAKAELAAANAALASVPSEPLVSLETPARPQANRADGTGPLSPAEPGAAGVERGELSKCGVEQGGAQMILDLGCGVFGDEEAELCAAPSSKRLCLGDTRAVPAFPLGGPGAVPDAGGRSAAEIAVVVIDDA